MNNLTYHDLYTLYQEALDTITDLQMEVCNLKLEVDEYCQAFEELQDKLSTI